MAQHETALLPPDGPEKQPASRASGAAPVQGHALTPEQFLAMTMSNMAQTAESLKQAIETLKTGKADAAADICRLIRCPRLAQYERGLRLAIDVLEKTKSSFKSRELGALRRQLEEILAGEK